MGLNVAGNVTMVEDSSCDRPVIVVGSARSGTTIVARTIAANAGIAYWEEPALFSWARSLFPKVLSLTHHRNADSMADILTAGRKGNLRQHVANQYGKSIDEEFIEASDYVRSLLQEMMVECLKQQDAQLFLEKTPGELTELSLIHALFPQAKIVHVVRDGRAVVASQLNWRGPDGKRKHYYGKSVASHSGRSLFRALERLAYKVVPSMRDAYSYYVWFAQAFPPVEPPLGRYWRPASFLAYLWVQRVGYAVRVGRLLPKACYTELRYEDFVRHPKQATQDVMDFIGQTVDDRQERFLQRGMGGGVSASSAEAYRKRLGAGQIKRVEVVAGPLLRELGYLS